MIGEVTLPLNALEIDSVEPIWKTANWHERETHEIREGAVLVQTPEDVIELLNGFDGTPRSTFREPVQAWDIGSEEWGDADHAIVPGGQDGDGFAGTALEVTPQGAFQGGEAELVDPDRPGEGMGTTSRPNARARARA